MEQILAFLNFSNTSIKQGPVREYGGFLVKILLCSRYNPDIKCAYLKMAVQMLQYFEVLRRLSKNMQICTSEKRGNP